MGSKDDSSAKFVMAKLSRSRLELSRTSLELVPRWVYHQGVIGVVFFSRFVLRVASL